MDIEAIVNKYICRNGWSFAHDGECAEAMRAALTDLAQGYEQKIAGLESEAILSRALSERIRQMEADADDERDDVWHDQWESHEFGASG